MTASFQKELSSQLQHMRKCRGAKECFLKASQSFSVRRVRELLYLVKDHRKEPMN